MKKSTLKASFVKKAGAVVLSCVLLCGQGMSAAAATSAATVEPLHDHVYVVKDWQLIGYAPYKHHDYIKDGKVQSCAIWMYVYSGKGECSCGAIVEPITKSDYVHLNCGQ